jgi:ribosomal protein S18 acetylase RimI-like enzyme
MSFNDFWMIYEDSFPVDERRSISQQLELIGNDSYMKLDIFHEGEYAGFMAFWDLDSIIFIEHFAIKRELRGRGIGKAFLGEFLRNVGRTVVLEVELPADEEKIRRIHFYERMGFSYSGFTYNQRPYVSGGSEVPLSLMTYPEGLEIADLYAIKETIFSAVYSLCCG